MKTLLLMFAALTAVPSHAQNSLQQPVGTELSKTTGSVIMRINRQKRLKNAFGGNDIFGGRTDAGFFEVRYMGLSPKKMPKFSVSDVHKSSSETTMTRYGRPTNVNVEVSGSPDAAAFEHDLAEGNTLEFEGYTLTIIKATGSKLTYQID